MCGTFSALADCVQTGVAVNLGRSGGRIAQGAPLLSIICGPCPASESFWCQLLVVPHQSPSASIMMNDRRCCRPHARQAFLLGRRMVTSVHFPSSLLTSMSP